jgi:hypothetical protein
LRICRGEKLAQVRDATATANVRSIDTNDRAHWR